MIEGFLETVDQFQARGWVFDRDDPGGHIELEFVLDGEPLGTITANLFRHSLVSIGIGTGDHGFVFNFPVPLDGGDLVRVRVQARTSDGSHIELPRAQPAEEPPPLVAVRRKRNPAPRHAVRRSAPAPRGEVGDHRESAAAPGIDEADLADLAAWSGDPWMPDNPYFAAAEKGITPAWEQLVWPFIDGCDFTAVVDLAAGHGRNSAVLLKLCRQLTIMDIQPGNIDACRERFGDRPNVEFIVNNGFDFEPIPDSSVTLIYCFDAMVHFDSDVVRSYLRDAARVLVPGGRAFLHHANQVKFHDWRGSLHARNFMSQELFAHYAMKEGLDIVRQRVIDWAGVTGLDCFSLVERPE